MDIIISFKDFNIKASFNREETAAYLYKNLPFSQNISCWGGEIYFSVNAVLPLANNASSLVEAGDIAYWPGMGGVVCVFFGKTPASRGEKPEAAAPVNVIGRIYGNLQGFRTLNDGDRVTFSACKEK